MVRGNLTRARGRVRGMAQRSRADLALSKLVTASATKGARHRSMVTDAIGEHRAVGDIRGRGLFLGIELVADRDSRDPYPRAARVTERVVQAARERGLLVYSGTGVANGVDGDTILLGPPFVVTESELERIAAVLADAIEAGVAAAAVGESG